MKIFILPAISIIMSIFYYVPWIGETTRGKLGPYILSFLWFLAAWIIMFVYVVIAFKKRKDEKEKSRSYYCGALIFAISYLVIFIGIIKGYMVTV